MAKIIRGSDVGTLTINMTRNPGWEILEHYPAQEKGAAA